MNKISIFNILLRLTFLFSGLFISTQQAVAQAANQKAYSWWLLTCDGFGNPTGFNFNNPGSNGLPQTFTIPVPATVPLQDRLLGADETNSIFAEPMASISDDNGNLQLMSDGLRIYDKNGMLISPQIFNGNLSTSQMMMLRQPGRPNIVYVFFITQGFFHNINGEGSSEVIADWGLSYTVVDLCLNNGLGAVISANNLVVKDDEEVVTAVRHANGKDYWIVAVNSLEHKMVSFLLDQDSLHVSNPVLSAAYTPAPPPSGSGPGMTNPQYAVGQLKANRQANKIALGRKIVFSSVDTSRIDIFDFDNSTGICSNKVRVDFSQFLFSDHFGHDFSPDGTKLYVSTLKQVMQVDMSTPNWTYTVLEQIQPNANPGARFKRMQLCEDGRIYVTVERAEFIFPQGNPHNYYNVIMNPNAAGTACNYVPNALDLTPHVPLDAPNGMSQVIWLHESAAPEPQQPLSLSVTATDSCANIFQLTVNGATVTDSLSWNFGDGSSLLSGNTASVLHDYNTGLYTAQVTIKRQIPGTCTFAAPEILSATIIADSCTGSDPGNPNNPGNPDNPVLSADCKPLMPTAFTPNGDGLNDIFLPFFPPCNDKTSQTYILNIYNRWGQQVFSSIDKNKGWDGMVKGAPGEQAVYFYSLYLSRNNAASFFIKGDVTLVR